MVAQRTYENDILRELRDQQVRYAPREKRIEQADRAEVFFYEVDPKKTYTYQEVCKRVTDFKAELHPDTPLPGASLRHDLLRLIEDLTESALPDAAEAGEKVWTVDEICERLQVSSKTIARWRKTLLVSRRFLIKGKKRIGFLDSSLRRFIEGNRKLVEHGSNFSQLTDEDRTTILRLARRLAKEGENPTETARYIAEVMGHSLETIRHILKNFDELNPDLAMFPNRKTPMDEDLRRLIYDRFRLGESVEHLADVFQRTPGSIYRIIGQMRAARIVELPLDYIDNPAFASLKPAEEAVYCGPTPKAPGEDGESPTGKRTGRSRRRGKEIPDFVEISDSQDSAVQGDVEETDDTDFSGDDSDIVNETPESDNTNGESDTDEFERGTTEHASPEDGLPPYLEGLYAIPLLTREQEVHLFRKMNYLKYKAARLRETLDPERPKTGLMEKLENLYNEAIACKNQIVTANLRLVVSIAKRHIGSGISFFDLISDGNLALIKAVEKFDYARGNKFSTYATWAIVRCFARSVPDEKKYRARYRSAEDEMLEGKEDDRNNAYVDERLQAEREQQVDRLLGQLDTREQQIIMRRYGLGSDHSSKTLREVGSEMGVTKERVRQIEARALQKLRKVAEEENLEIPEL